MLANCKIRSAKHLSVNSGILNFHAYCQKISEYINQLTSKEEFLPSVKNYMIKAIIP